MDSSQLGAVIHLDHNAGTKNRLWRAARSVLEAICSSQPSRCQDSLFQLRRSRAGVGIARRSAIVRAVLKAACGEYQPSSTHLIQLNASSTAATLLRPQESTQILEGLPLHLANCTHQGPLPPWQRWRLSVLSRSPNASGACTGMCQLFHFRLEASPSLCLALGKSRSPRQPYSSLAQLTRCSRLSGGERRLHKDPPPHLLRARLSFNTKSGLVQTTHKLREIKRKLPEHQIDCGFWSTCTGTKTVLGKPCWLDLKHTPSACGSSEPTIANILQRAKHPHTRPGYGNITLGPTGPLPWPVLSSPGGAHLCMRSWRGGFTQRNAVAFQQCPQDRTRGLHRWGGAELFAWELTSVDGSPVTPGYPSEAVTVNLRPQAARHMCLTAPPLHVAHGSGSNPKGGDRGEGNEEGGRGARSSRRQVKLSTRKVVQAKRVSALT
ncbi:MAG: hypothetical protein SGPRY_009598 [Prymnesium sp.]